MKKKMNLSDNDKREIIQLIQEKKTLPEKYRFLLFKDQDAIEILWNGKSNDITNTVLPFQIIEHVDEPRDEREIKLQGNLFDDSGRKIMGWSNKLIWGNNNLILSSLLNGPLAEDIKNQGGIKMIYIDPPFNTQSDFSIKIKVGDDDFEKKRNFLEEIAYRDTWNKHRDSFLSMIYERIVIAKHLLTNDGLFFIHCDLRTSAAIKLVLDEVFGFENYINTIYSLKVDGIHLVFLGALSDLELVKEAREEISNPDIIFVPIGGNGLLDVKQAVKLVSSLEPKMVIPMDYDTNILKAFLKETDEEEVETLDKLTIKRKDLENKENEVVVLKIN
jgi:adenine specific DNA methylase Mod